MEYMLAGKTLLYYTNLLAASDYRKYDKIIYISISKINIVEEASLELRLRKIDETRH